jgi:hypothetical protein
VNARLASLDKMEKSGSSSEPLCKLVSCLRLSSVVCFAAMHGKLEFLGLGEAMLL